MKKILLLVLLIPFSVCAEDLKLASGAKSAILVEASTGQILFEKNADDRLVPASMTKMMSMLLILEAIENNVIKWDQMVTVSENASSMGGSQILLETGEKMSVSDLFKGVAISSGNDAVVALAEASYGSENVFVNRMNERAKELGLENTYFKNPHGLDTADHYSSARDMSVIARELVKHEKVFEFTSVYEDYLRQNTDRKIWLVNTNRLVRFYEGVDGLKTGFTDGAGYCMTATAKKNGMRIIAVVMGEETSKIRNKEISEMLDYSFAQYEIKNLKNSLIGKYKVIGGDKRDTYVYSKDEVNVLVRKGDDVKNYSYKIDINNLKAPIFKNGKVGSISVIDGKKNIRSIDLIVKEDIKRIKFIRLLFRNVYDIIVGNF